MEIQEPIDGEITVYSKSGCINCVKVKTLLKEKGVKFSIINCDEYILEDKAAFLQYINLLVGKEYKTFPMIFLNKTFIGGFNETEQYFSTKELTFNSDF
jgi:glutaredoxin